MRRTVPLASRAWIVGAVISALILATAPAGVLATGTPRFQPYEFYQVGSWPEAVAIGDVTGDGRNDVVMTTGFYFDPDNDYRVWVFAQAADGTLFAPVSYPTGYTDNRPESVAVGDITGDGKADVVVGVTDVGVQVFPQLVGGSLGTPVLYPTSDSFKIRLGKLNGDGRLDVAGVSWGSDTVSVLLNDNHGGLLPPTSYAARHGRGDLEVADVSNDGRDDLIVMSEHGLSPDFSVLAQLPAGGFGTAAEYRVFGLFGSYTHGIGVGDMNGDGRKDAVVSGDRPSSSIAIFAQTSTGTLATPVSYPSYDAPGPVEVADVDLDGRPDVVTDHTGGHTAGVFRQLPDGSLAPEERYELPDANGYNPHGLAVGDINSDGAPDVVVATVFVGLSVLRNTKAPPPPLPDQLTALTAPKIWVGLKNSDDVGIRFDLRAEVYRDATLVTSGEAKSVAAGSSGFVKAVLDTIPLNTFAPVWVFPGSQLSIKLFVRNACSGSTHSSGVARLWYNDSMANSSFGATIAGSASTYSILADGNLSTSPGTGPKATIDIAAGARCSAFKSFGTWSLSIP